MFWCIGCAMSLNVRYVLKQRTTPVAKPILRAAFRVLYPVRKRIGALRMRRWAQRLRFESWALHRCTWPNWNNDWHVARAHRRSEERRVGKEWEHRRARSDCEVY